MNKNLDFFFALVRANALLARRLSGHGLDFTDFMILYYLNAAPGGKLRRIDLAERLGLTASGITRMLLPLEKLHIVKRDLDSDDARARYASLTPAGKNLLDEAAATIDNKIEEIIPENKIKKMAELTGMLAAISGQSGQN